MTIEPGRSLSHYRLAEKIGEGGMGAVWRAVDTTLGREVAIKVLPAAFAGDPERLLRFEREAKLLASLNHPNIAAIYGLHEAEGVRFLAMELVPGEDLSERLKRGRIPPREAIELARQIGEALEIAHEQGVIHRDLKPANIRLTPDGKVKVLDFGLAKALDPMSSFGSGAQGGGMSPTITSLGTVAGVILGTAAYMSPEQARGKAADRRADVWAFGVILFEMLSGKRLFDGETISDTLASVLKTDPDWGALPAETPQNIRRLLRRCLAKDPRSRLRSAGDALLELDTDEPAAAAEAPPAPARSQWRERAAWAAVLGLALLLAVKLADSSGSGNTAGRFPHLEIPYGDSETGTVLAPPMISPDGNKVVYGLRVQGAGDRLFIRRLEGFEARPLPETEDAIFPFWSADSRSVAYFTRGSLRRIDVDTGTTQIINDHAPWGRGGSWNEKGQILFAPHPNSGIHLTAVGGGSDTELTVVDPKLIDASHRFPCWLPDGKHFVFTLWSNNADVLKKDGGVYVGSTSKEEPIRRVLVDASRAVYVNPGFLLVHRNERLMAIPFDPESWAVGDEAVPIDSGVAFNGSTGSLAASASRRGDLAYGVGPGDLPNELLWLDRQGQVTESLHQTGQFSQLALSPDGRRYAAARSEGTNAEQIWIGDLARGASVPLTHGANDSYDPVWSPDGQRVAFSSRETGNEDLYVQSVAGTTPWEMIHKADTHDTNVTSWSADGRYLVFGARPRKDAGRFEIWIHDFHDKKARSILADTFPQRDGVLSPDGRWLAYTSEEGGTPQIFVRPFPALDRKWLISTGQGDTPHWRADSREIWYRMRDALGTHMMSAALAPNTGDPNPAAPVQLFTLDPRIVFVEPNADHTRLLAGREVASPDKKAIRLILDWAASLKAGEPQR
jgi:Tol biopolymer transport system component